MNKQGMLATVAVLALAYPAANWYVGTRIEATRAAQYAKAEAATQNLVKVVRTEFKRGVYRSEEVVTLELRRDLLAAAAPGAAAPPPVEVTFRTAYRHGPLAGFKPVLAVADSELVFSDETGAQVAKLYGKQKPLSVHTVVNFDGSGTAHLTSPGFDRPSSGKDDDVTVQWGGLDADVAFTTDASQAVLHGALPRIAVGTGTRGGVEIADVRFEGNLRRLLADNPYLYAGTQSFTVGRMQVTPTSGDAPVSLKDLTYAVEVPVHGDFIDLIARFGVSSIQVGAKGAGPVRYELSLRHLSAQKAANLYRLMMDTYGSPVQAPDEDPAQRLRPLVAAGIDLLQDDPELRIDRLSIAMGTDESVMTGRAQLRGATREDFAAPARLLARLDASAELAVPEPLLDAFIANTAKSPEEARTNRARMQQQLDMVVQQGFVERDGDVIKSNAVFVGGTLKINGTPVPFGQR